MSVTAPTPITALPTPPTTSDAANFDTRADAFLAALPNMTTQTNAVATNVFTNATDAATNATAAAASAVIATAIGNFKGNWVDLTGALNMPATVLYSGVYWQLVSNLANVTTATPGVSGAWTQLTPVPVASGGTGSNTGAGLALAGEVKMWPTGTAPAGHLLCNGAAVSRATYAALFAVVSTTFGVGDGSTTFNLPDFRDRMPIGAGSTYAANAAGGSADSALPSHSHTINITDPGHSHTRPDFATAGGTGVSTGVKS